MSLSFWWQAPVREWGQGAHHLTQVKRQNLCASGTQTTTNGDVFTVICGVDYPGNDLSRLASTSVANCVEQCSVNHPLCVAVAFEASAAHGPNNCYLKSALGTAVTQTFSMDGAYSVPTGTPETCSSEDASYVSTTSSGSKVSFKLICGKDYPGNDMLQFHANSLDACMDICATYTPKGCVGVAFDAGIVHGFSNCYLKNAVGTPTVQSFVVDGALVVSSSSSSSSSASASKTSSSSTITSSLSSTSSTTTSSSTSAAGASQTTAPVSNGGSSVSGVKIGVGVGVPVVVILVAIVIAFFFRRRRRQSQPQTPAETQSQSKFLPFRKREKGPPYGKAEVRGELDATEAPPRELEAPTSGWVHELPGTYRGA